MPYPEVHCPHCHKAAMETRSFLLGDANERYCNECGWNTEKAARNLRIDMWVMLGFSVVGVLLTAKAWMAESLGPRMALGVAILVVALPFGSGIVTRYRLSKIVVARRQVSTPVSDRTSAPAKDDPLLPSDASLTIRPRAVRFTKRGHIYSVGMALATAFVLWVLSFGLRGLLGPSGAGKMKSVLVVVLWTVFLWSCVSFYANRIRERRLFLNGELSRGIVMAQSNTQLGSRIVYSYSDKNGNGFQNRATDFSKKLYEDMPVHVFYDTNNSRASVILEGSLFQLF